MDERGRLLTPAFLLVACSNFAAFLSIGVLLPTLPRFADGPLSAGEIGVGLSIGAASITALLFQPLAGRVGDRRGRRILMVGGATVMVLAALGLLLVGSLTPVVALRLLSGVGEACFLVGAATSITDLAPEARRGEAVSLFTLASYTGLALGPLLGEIVLAGDNFDAVWLLAAGLAVAAGLIALRVPETRPDEPSAEHGALVHRAAIGPGLVLLLGLFSFGGFNAFIALYALEVGLERAGFIFLVFSAVVIAVRGLGARIPDRLGSIRTAQLALVFLAAGMAIIGGLHSAAGLYLGTMVFAVGQSLAFPALLMLALRGTPQSQRSSVVGTFTAFVDLGLALGAVSLGAVARVAGYRGAFLTAAVVAASGLAVLARVSAAKKESG